MPLFLAFHLGGADGRLPLKREEGYSWCVLGWSLLLVALDEIFIVGVAEVNLLHEIACLACAV